MPSRRRARRERNLAKKIAKLSDDSCADESQGIEYEERDSFQEAHEKKKACDRKHYKANTESKKESTKAQYWLDPESKKESAKAHYWLDPESKKESVKAYYDQNRELILASKQAQKQANPKAKRVISRKKKAAGKEILRGRSVCMYTVWVQYVTRKGPVYCVHYSFLASSLCVINSKRVG